MREYTDGDDTYIIGDLTPFEAFHVSRKLLPVLAGLSGLAGMADSTLKALEPTPGTDPGSTSGLQLETLLITLKPLVDVVSQMSEADSEFVIKTCLANVQRVATAGKNIAVFNKRAGTFQFPVDLRLMMTLTGISIMDNLGDFLPKGAD